MEKKQNPSLLSNENKKNKRSFFAKSLIKKRNNEQIKFIQNKSSENESNIYSVSLKNYHNNFESQFEQKNYQISSTSNNKNMTGLNRENVHLEEISLEMNRLVYKNSKIYQDQKDLVQSQVDSILSFKDPFGQKNHVQNYFQNSLKESSNANSINLLNPRRISRNDESAKINSTEKFKVNGIDYQIHKIDVNTKSNKDFRKQIMDLLK